MSSTLTANLMFFGEWLRSPREVGAWLPSGRALASAMAEQVDPGSGSVMELGAGTGVVTRALLDRGIAPERLVMIEKSPVMALDLQQQFPQSRVLQGDAARLRRLIGEFSIEQPLTAVSSLPLLCLTRWQRVRVLKEISLVLAPGGRLIQFTYSSASPISVCLADALGFDRKRVRRIALNLPPAAVWVYTKQEEARTCCSHG